MSMSNPAVPTPFPVAPDATNSLGDPYAQTMGNPGYDAQHYTLDMVISNDDLKYIAATTTIEAIATTDLPTFNLDFLGLYISAIAVDGVAADFSRKGQELTIVPATPIAAGAHFVVSVTYSGHPEPYLDPQFVLYGAEFWTGWREWSDGYVAAMSQPSSAMTCRGAGEGARRPAAAQGSGGGVEAQSGSSKGCPAHAPSVGASGCRRGEGAVLGEIKAALGL